MKKQLYILLLLFLLTACKENNKEKFALLVQEWQGKEIVFPQNMAFTRFVTEPVDYRIPDAEYKVLIYVDSTGCTSCKLQLPKWKELIAHVDSATNGNIPFIFVFQSKDDRELRYILKRDNFARPVCIDRNNRFDELNQFPQDITFQTFLLDRNNKVRMIGNPIYNLAVKDLYLKQLTGKTSSDRDQIKTTVKAINNKVDFGTFLKSEEKTAVFEIENTGDNPLVILGISTTCGCTTANYDKHPAKPGERLRIEIRMTPKDTGFFDEIVTLKCNTTSPVKVKIRGLAQ
ncbi:DUF1573 domain-containing protein [uncultured Parabacteroides sp.]|jgi:hypothetical protein|uniref:DUF1573 domain-containing protein n=1 Tax=uncultured Parabacteroides sp. TaxID=512312 RepID=UPI0025D8EEBD|nr:DUF1573 domain-containing protein [uncultured Parabacteroides sp.]